MVMIHTDSYSCVHCGERCPQLFKQYSVELIEVSKCSCGKIADPYIEYDNIIIFLDVILLRIQAFRHLLFNAGFREKWALRLLAFTCLCEAYHHWALEHRTQQAITAAIEISYYIKLCKALSGVLLQTALTLVLLCYRSSTYKGGVTHVRSIAEGILLCNYSMLYLMVIHIWIPESASYCYYLLKLYKVVTCYKALEAITNDSSFILGVISVLSCGADLLMNTYPP